MDLIRKDLKRRRLKVIAKEERICRGKGLVAGSQLLYLMEQTLK